MTLDEFDKFTACVIEVLDYDRDVEYYNTPQLVCEHLLAEARKRLYSNELKEIEERKLLQQLIAKYGVPK